MTLLSMKSSFLHFSALVALASSGFFQPLLLATVPVALDVATVRAKMSEAKNLAKANNVAGAEQVLLTLNRAKPNTAGWHMETAQRLMGTAEQLAREARPASIAPLTASALSHLAQADTLTTDARIRAAAKTLAGFIHERYLADRKSALASFQSAALLSPTTATSAKEAADRLQKTEDKARAKVNPTGK